MLHMKYGAIDIDITNNHYIIWADLVHVSIFHVYNAVRTTDYRNTNIFLDYVVFTNKGKLTSLYLYTRPTIYSSCLWQT